MADQNFMDLASKTASGIAGTDYMMLVNNSEAYKALVNDVAEAILSKLTSKSFSGLETTAKNVIGALNELNSNALHFSYGSTKIDKTIHFGLKSSRATIILVGNNATGNSYVGMIEIDGTSVSLTKISGYENSNFIVSKDENTVSIKVDTEWFSYAVMSTSELIIS